MNQDPNNPTMPNPAPVAPGFANPAAAATPNLAAPAPEMPVAPVAPEAPAMPEAPTIDASLLQEAIADVPDEAAATTPETPSAVPLDNLGAPAEAPAEEVSPFAGAAPAMDTPVAPTPETPADPNAAPVNPTAPTADEGAKNPPSVAFNDPAQQPDAKSHASIQIPAIVEKLKANPVALIVGGALIIIIALVLIIANV